MYVVAQHRIVDPPTAFSRGEKLVRNEGAPPDVTVLQFYPSSDGSAVTCLWEATTVDSVQGYVDSVLAESAENVCYEVNGSKAFASHPSLLPESPALVSQTPASG